MIGLLRLPMSLAMLLYQSVALAVAQIWASKLRAVLTTLGILIGVASVSSVIALIDSMTERVIAEFEAFGATKLFISPRWRETDYRNGSFARMVFAEDCFDELLERCPSVDNFARAAGFGALPTAYRGRVAEEHVNFIAIDDEWHAMERRTAALGRPLSDLDSRHARAVCVINQRLRDELKLDRDPTGSIIDVFYFGRMRVVGLLEQPLSIFSGQSNSSELMVPYTLATSRFSWPLYYEVIASSRGRELVESAKDEIEFYLRQKRGLRPGEQANFEITTASRILEEIKKTAAFMTTLAGGIVAISMLVGGVGIMNIMLVSVSERTREIGLRKAVGAPPAAILLQFLVEAVVLCLIGGAMGVVLGIALTGTVSSLLPESLLTVIGGQGLAHAKGIREIVVPTHAISLALGFSALVGIVFGFFPAIKAAALDPIEALRHE